MVRQILYIYVVMNLFNPEPGETINLLPHDGAVYYYGRPITKQQANDYFNLLLKNIDWKNDEVVIFGKHIITKRKVAWYANDNYIYTYSGISKQALRWTKELAELKAIVEKNTGSQFNSCLLNLYHNGDEGMTWHSDDEKSIGSNTAIASFSFGAERKFSFKHKKTKETISLILENGSMLLMKDTTQTNWLHSLPKTKRVSTARINLTFRTMLV